MSTARGEMVVRNDPGDPEGRGRMVPVAEFANAWADSGGFMVVAGPTADDGIEVFDKSAIEAGAKTSGWGDAPQLPR